MTRFAACVLVACSATPVPHANRSANDVLVAYRLDVRDGVTLEQAFPGQPWPPEVGAKLAVVDDGGFVGVVAAIKREKEPAFTLCYDGPCPLVWPAKWIEHAREPSVDADAIGPYGESLRAIRRVFPVPRPIGDDTIGLIETTLPETPTTFRAWDVAGTGHADFEMVQYRSGTNGVFEIHQRRAGARVLTFTTSRPLE
jgi:hypothetical protein